MLKNYLKIAWRNFVKQKGYSFLNMGGLAIGMACAIHILLWVHHESSYDDFHENSDQIYRLTAEANEDFKAAVSPAGMVEELPDLMTQIHSSVRLSRPFEELFEVNGEKFKESGALFVDANFLEVFTFPLIEGDPETALDQPDGILITRTIAQNFFGEEQALGKAVKVNNADVFTVTGVLEDPPSNSHLQFKILLPMAHYAKTDSDLINKVWDSFNFYGYFKFQNGAISNKDDLSRAVQEVNQIYAERMPEFEIIFDLQPLTDIHLHSSGLQIDLAGHGNIQYVNIFFIAALIILIVACINYMNLATARSSKRAREVGMRKVIGADRRQLAFQFLGESLMISFLSLILAVGIVYLSLPAFNNLAQKQLELNLEDTYIWMGILGIVLVTGLVSGSYPALFLSSFKPVKVLKGKLKLSGSNLMFRNGLVVLQFATSVLLLVGTMVIYSQLNYIRDKNLGYNKSNLIYVPMEGEIFGKQDALRTALEQNPLTADFSIISDLPANLESGDFAVTWEGKDPDAQILFPSIRADENFQKVFQMEMVEGRNFTSSSEENNDFIINETAAKIIGKDLGDVLGKSLTFYDRKGTIIGVVKDFNYKPLQYAIEPLILSHRRTGAVTVVRTAPEQTEATIASLEEIYATLNPAYPLAYGFVDSDLDAQYKGERQMGSIFNLFALLAIFISCLGLYGLSAFMTEQRFKEIGIRKVLGASMALLVNMLSRDFVRLVLLAFLIATPIAWYLMDGWLEGFAYRIDIQWWMFAATGLAILLVAITTVSYHSIRAANANPIKSIRTE